MGNYLGSKHTLGFKPQASAGTPETTVTHFMPGKGLVAEPNRSLVDRVTTAALGYALPSKAGAINPSGKYGPCEIHASLPHPFYWLMGAVSPTTVTTGVYLHTIPEADDPVRLTVEANKVHSSAKQGDARMSKMSVKGTAGETATIESMEWLALSHDASPTLTSTPTYTTDPLILTSAVVKIDGAQVYTVPVFSLDIDRALDGLPVLTDTSGGQPQLIRRKTASVITGSLDFLDFPTAEYTKFIAATSFALIIELQGAVITGQYKNFLRFTFPVCQYTGGLDAEIGDDMITGTAQFKVAYDTVTSRQILIEAQNGLSVINT